MKLFVHQPARWDNIASAHWRDGRAQEALDRSMAILEGMAEPDADAFIQPAYYLFEMNRHLEGAALLEKGIVRFPAHPMIRLALGSSYTRARKHRLAIPHLEEFMKLGMADLSACDALAHSYSETGDFVRARMFGTMSLQLKDLATRERHGSPLLNRSVDPAGKPKVIAFSLFGSGTKYLRGALHNVLAIRDVYPDWTCRIYADESVDAALLGVLIEEGADVVMDDSGNEDFRYRLSRRFYVNDDADVGYFMVRDIDSAVNPREAAAVAEWMDSGLPFHVMRDWYTHTDPMLAGMWGGIAGVFPDMRGHLEQFLEKMPPSTNWDQFFLRDQVWPAIRDDVMVHDRYFGSHRARPFPTPTPAGTEHVGQNEFASDAVAQAGLMEPYVDRVPALGIRKQALNLKFKSTL